MKAQKTYSCFRNVTECWLEEGYHMVKGVPVRVEWDEYNEVYWLTFRNRKDYEKVMCTYSWDVK